jgi:hypothetical protein
MGGLWGDTYYPEPTFREKIEYLVDWIKYVSLAFIERLRPMAAKKKGGNMSYISEALYTDLQVINDKLVEMHIAGATGTYPGESSSGQGTGLQNQKAQEPIEGSTPSSPAKKNICLRR